MASLLFEGEARGGLCRSRSWRCCGEVAIAVCPLTIMGAGRHWRYSRVGPKVARAWAGRGPATGGHPFLCVCSPLLPTLVRERGPWWVMSERAWPGLALDAIIVMSTCGAP